MVIVEGSCIMYGTYEDIFLHKFKMMILFKKKKKNGQNKILVDHTEKYSTTYFQNKIILPCNIQIKLNGLTYFSDKYQNNNMRFYR